MSSLFPYELSAEIREKASDVKFLVLDVDGVLTGGNLLFDSQGEQLKEFSILDGLGIKLLRDAGIETGIITGRLSGMVARRMHELGVTHVIQGREDKLTALEELLKSTNLSLEATAYIGDDLPDLSAIQSVRFSAAPCNAHHAVKHYADWICAQRGGQGAVREVADVILESCGLYESTIAKFSQ